MISELSKGQLSMEMGKPSIMPPLLEAFSETVRDGMLDTRSGGRGKDRPGAERNICGGLPKIPLGQKF